MALLRAVHSLSQANPGPGRVLAAHVNHRLRGAESDADEEFVREVCSRLGLELMVHRLEDSLAGAGLEERARAARYELLTQTAEERGARFVAVAHTADDQAETILHHVLRGTGLTGLAGMSKFRSLSPAVTLVRPLLGTRRQSLRDYLAEVGQDFREDSSNADTSFTRNRLRHELLPHLAEHYNPSVIEALVRLGHLAAESRTIVEAHLEPLLDQAVQIDGDPQVVTMDCAALAEQSRPMVRELLIAAWNEVAWGMGDMTFAHWEQLAELIIAPTARKVMFPGAIVAERAGTTVTLRKA